MGVACLNAQLFTHEQEDDLEHAGHLFFSQSQRQHANLTENLVHKPRGPRVLPLREYSTGVPSHGTACKDHCWPGSKLDGVDTGCCCLED